MKLGAGFTLVELMVTVVIVAILASLSVAGYGQYVRRANRVDATGALLKISAAQERFYLQNDRYASSPGELAAAPPDGLGIEGTEFGYYDLELAAGPDGDAVGYIATATATADGPQRDDDDCREFSINEQSFRAAETAGGDTSVDITARCWR
jgi:type IV pilus assembly protein PilE